MIALWISVLPELESLAEDSESHIEASKSLAEDSESRIEASKSLTEGLDGEESDVEKSIRILKNSADPENLLDMWEKTTSFRIDSIKEIDFFSYMQTYPCLLTNSGYKLVCVWLLFLVYVSLCQFHLYFFSLKST